MVYQAANSVWRVRVTILYGAVFATCCFLTAYLFSTETAPHEQQTYLHRVRITTRSRSGTLNQNRRGLHIDADPRVIKNTVPQYAVSHSTGTGTVKPLGAVPKQGHHVVEGLPDDFDWRAYLLWNPDLRTANIRTEEMAMLHFTHAGRNENRMYKRIPILLRYTACQGLFNQMYAHLGALILADHLGADVILAASVYRESFSKYFSTDKTKNQVSWTPTSVRALVDLEAVQTFYQGRGMKITEAPWEGPFPDCTHPQDAFPVYETPNITAEQRIQLPNIYLQSMHIWYIWDRAADKVLAKAQALHKQGYPLNTTVVLDLPCPFLSIMTLTCMESAMDAASALKFNKTIMALASEVVEGMRASGAGIFNGAHLRLEKDAIDWARILGGVDRYLNEYRKSFAAAGFNKEKHLYIASGLLSYNASKEMQDLMTFLDPWAKTVHYKERYLKPEQLRGLNPEQQALVDFLVLAQADMFVGLGSSTFSVYLREYRVLSGKLRSAHVFVDSRRIGTDPLFERCTHFAPLDAH